MFNDVNAKLKTFDKATKLNVFIRATRSMSPSHATLVQRAPYGDTPRPAQSDVSPRANQSDVLRYITYDFYHGLNPCYLLFGDSHCRVLAHDHNTKCESVHV